MEIAGQTLDALTGPAGMLRHPFIFILVCLALDIVLGDPQYAWHPIRVTGKVLTLGEKVLRKVGWHGRIGGFMLFLWLLLAWGGGAIAVNLGLRIFGAWLQWPSLGWALSWVWEVFLGYSLLALGDLIDHGKRIARATVKKDLGAARLAAGMLVGRDTEKMDFAACNRAAVESLAESLCDGVIAPLFWFALLGLPGLVLFKVASTMDSMVGYRNERYLRFGWFGARLDDVMNYVPARITVLLIGAFSAVAPGYSAAKAISTALLQHGILPGPNKGWSETAAAGALNIRLAGPIWKHGKVVNTIWIGPADGPEGGTAKDVYRMIALAYGATALFVAGIGIALGIMPFLL